MRTTPRIGWRKRVARSAVVIVALIAMGGFAETTTRPNAGEVDPAVLAAFDALAAAITRVSDRTLSTGQRLALLVEVRVADAAYQRHLPCEAAHVLGAYLHLTQGLRSGARQGVAEGLYNQGRQLRDDIVAGVPSTSPCHDPRAELGAPDVRLQASDNQRFRAVVNFGAPRFLIRQIDGEVWTEVEIPGLRAGIEHGGTPAVPVFRHLLGVPAGAQIEFTSIRPRVAETIKMHLIPFQSVRHLARVPLDHLSEPPPPSAYADGPFEQDAGAYATNAVFPAPVCRGGHLGRARDLSLAVIECAAGQYNPVTNTLTLFEAVEFEVAFRGGSGHFITDTALSPFEPVFGTYYGGVMNRDAIGRFVGRDARRIGCVGEELLILTHPDFRPAAETLAQWKRTKGIATSVFEVNDGNEPGPDTNEEIDAFIEHRYATCLVRPAYVLLLGDIDRVPTFVLPRLMRPGDTVGTDHPYACQPGSCSASVLGGIPYQAPSFAVGRISVDTVDAAQAVIDKLVRYESAPPADQAFYQNATVASYFECCRADLQNVPDPNGWEDVRAFVQNAEFVRSVLTGRGFAVERIYSTDTANHSEYHGDDTPRYFSTGVSLPPPLRPQDGFPWDGARRQVTGTFEDGRFLVVHIDHGFVSGWVSPPFDSADAAGLGNGARLPVVFSLNCSSGAFDAQFLGGGDAFAEVLLAHPKGGAVGVFAFSREAEASSFRLILEGALDALWPELLPDFGAAVARQRLGDILISSKLRLLTLTGSPDPAVTTFQYTTDHLRIYHLFGDPTLEMWTIAPPVLPDNVDILVGPEGPEIFYAVEGAIITGFQETADGLRPIGRAAVRDGVARLTFQPLLPGVPLLLSASMPNAVSVSLTPRAIP